MFATRPSAFRAFAQQCPRSTFSSNFQTSSPVWRFFSYSAPRAKAAVKAKKPVAPQPKVQEPAEDTLRFAGRRPAGSGRLAAKVAKEPKGELMLFQAPSHRSYVLGAYGITAFCFAYSVYNSNITFRDPIAPLPMWQKVTFGSICVMMSVMGTVFMAKTNKLIRTVKAVNKNGEAYIRFTVRSFIPFRKPYEFDALPRQVAFARRLVISPDAASKRSTIQQSAQVSFFRQPLKKMSMMFYKTFRAIRQLFTGEDFILIEVDGQKGEFRMDAAGYVSQDFLSVGNPVTVRR
ncbi:hypothetical protein ASPACDRAFT_79285 [Aspergillus aculeatus ATCC 16872]|uniref:Uncharacterized protein n=1 Tax=Aspergillus aculeatus (strain ATCC 16872 / CBS 172.66 / WB 5094) TaxID=690307 RepID=A0A1L9WTC8_ASPA1|nr:uncharacterized protein ASPACDRAFT_79285 [Aspergillus aculeatus ATCC 16872]OJJ99388.1 hypothetical protein ASPACDRAFT_79285 [Aspergillus aculeatus ATCC 16872]